MVRRRKCPRRGRMGKKMADIADLVLNLAIFLATLALVGGYWLQEGRKEPGKMRAAFRFYTTLSNVLCALTALLYAVARIAGEVPGWVWTLKYIGTAAVTVTMLTVFLFLAPSVGKDWYSVLLKGKWNLVMHLLTPVAALVSFCVFEKRGMTFSQSLWGLLPVALYGPLYLYRILYAPEAKRWKDFYGFNKNGKWPLSFAGMLLGTFLTCLGLMALQNL